MSLPNSICLHVFSIDELTFLPLSFQSMSISRKLMKFPNSNCLSFPSGGSPVLDILRDQPGSPGHGHEGGGQQSQQHQQQHPPQAAGFVATAGGHRGGGRGGGGGDHHRGGGWGGGGGGQHHQQGGPVQFQRNGGGGQGLGPRGGGGMGGRGRGNFRWDTWLTMKFLSFHVMTTHVYPARIEVVEKNCR